jgi:hypothetical protein
VRSTGRGDDDVFWLMTVSAALGSVSRAEAALSDEPWSALGRHTHTHGRALMAEVTGEPEEAARLFAEAAHGWQEWGSIPLRAYALVGLGRCSGDTAAFAEGQAIFTRLGATPIGVPVAQTRQQQV